MNQTTQENTATTNPELDARNQAVEKAYFEIIKHTSVLLQPFESVKYRKMINVNHSESGKGNSLINETLTFFWNITLTRNKQNYVMVYFTADAESITKFGQRLANRAIRQVFKCTAQEKNKPLIEDCVRLNNPGKVQDYFLSRLANGDNLFTTISEIDFKSAN
ncbi:hypothetical protein [Daejeonella sp. JGW-45]|uniref:hypothetical protein n=1 Tax=Daejeonella sp. JGW-45 TaxID=3034148 RepID=UPI0023EAB780|nr:hypothetical protein [Daejeonella sp. JGW-45]